jgi:hypothetical protein
VYQKQFEAETCGVVSGNKARLDVVVKEGFVLPICRYTRNRMHSPRVKTYLNLIHYDLFNAVT